MEAKDYAIVNHHAEIMAAVYDRINNVHKKPLHKGQILLAKDYFNKGLDVMMSQWGRNGGKTESALFISCVYCLLSPNALVLIVCPQLKQGKKIYWTSRRLQNYPPPQYVKEYSATEIRLTFTNGSSICIEGSENFDALRGVKPNLVIYDEFQNHSREFHLEVMQPNLLGKGSSLIIYGTPPKKRSAYYVEFWEQLKKAIKEGDGAQAYYEFPTSINPTIAPEKLAKIRRQLIESDNEVIWKREYEGKMAFGGEDVVFPKWEPQNHVRIHKLTTSYLETDRHKLKWYTICDPGTSTCFAVLFAAYNPYTQQMFILDEIYEKDRKRTDTRQIWERIRKKELELYPEAPERTWKRVYDEAAAWFQREVQANYHECMMPSQKMRAGNNEETDISRIKMLMTNYGSLTVSDRCYWLRWEIESFITDEEGNYPDVNNHLIDCFKYLMQISGWKLIEKADSELVPNVKVLNNRPIDVDPDEWANNIVENSLWVNGNDISSEYFN
jgi:hypothetical protein